QQRPEYAFVFEAGDGLAHVVRLIEDDVEVDAFRNAREDAREGVFHALDRLDRVGPGLTIDGNVDLTFPIDVNDVGLNGGSVLDRADVFDEDRSAVLDLDRKVVDVRDARNHAVGVDLIVEVADLSVAGRNEDVEIAERLDDIGRRKAVASQPVGIEINQNPP